jgi:hypothetical protein
MVRLLLIGNKHNKVHLPIYRILSIWYLYVTAKANEIGNWIDD